MKKYRCNIVVDYCIRGDEFNPHELLDTLNIPNTRSWKKGDKYIGKERDLTKNKIVECVSVQPWGIWGINANSEMGLKTIEEHILFILEKIEPHKQIIMTVVNSNLEFRSRFRIFYEFDKAEQDVGEFEINSCLLRRMSDLCQSIEFAFTTFDD